MKMKWKCPVKIRRVDVERALILCASALVVALALRQNTSLPYEEKEVLLPVVESAALDKEDTQETLVYYRDGDGYLVPVTCPVMKTDGIAKATLEMMVASGQNDLNAARMGLKTTIPEGTEIDLDISDGHARVDMSAEALNVQNAEEENAMLTSVVQTLCRFDSVEEVDFLFDGQKRSKLTYGSDVSGVFTGEFVNYESTGEVTTAGAKNVLLYFPSATGRMLVPVTRCVYSDADVTTAMLELVKGPKPDSGLESPLPRECGLIGVSMKNGVVTVNFTKEFITAMEGDLSAQTVRAITFTASQFPGVKEVRIQVEGKDYLPPDEAQSTFLNLSSEIVSYYPGVIETD